MCSQLDLRFYVAAHKRAVIGFVTVALLEKLLERQIGRRALRTSGGLSVRNGKGSVIEHLDQEKEHKKETGEPASPSVNIGLNLGLKLLDKTMR
jgi:hypothetical protein